MCGTLCHTVNKRVRNGSRCRHASKREVPVHYRSSLTHSSVTLNKGKEIFLGKDVSRTYG